MYISKFEWSFLSAYVQLCLHARPCNTTGTRQSTTSLPFAIVYWKYIVHTSLCPYLSVHCSSEHITNVDHWKNWIIQYVSNKWVSMYIFQCVVCTCVLIYVCVCLCIRITIFSRITREQPCDTLIIIKNVLHENGTGTWREQSPERERKNTRQHTKRPLW